MYGCLLDISAHASPTNERRFAWLITIWQLATGGVGSGPSGRGSEPTNPPSVPRPESQPLYLTSGGWIHFAFDGAFLHTAQTAHRSSRRCRTGSTRMYVVTIAAIVLAGYVVAVRHRPTTGSSTMTLNQHSHAQRATDVPIFTPGQQPQPPVTHIAETPTTAWESLPRQHQDDLPGIRQVFPDLFPPSHQPQLLHLHPLSSWDALAGLCDPAFRPNFVDTYMIASHFMEMIPEFVVEHDPVPMHSYAQSAVYRQLETTFSGSHFFMQIGMGRSLVVYCLVYQQPDLRGADRHPVP